MAERTPECWEIERENHGNGGYSEWLVIGPVRTHPTRQLDDDDWASARLIAALPALLAACESVVEWFERIDRLQDQLLGQEMKSAEDSWELATSSPPLDIRPVRDAIAKATQTTEERRK